MTDVSFEQLLSAIQGVETKMDSKFELLSTAQHALAMEFNSFLSKHTAQENEFNNYTEKVKSNCRAIIAVQRDIDTTRHELDKLQLQRDVCTQERKSQLLLIDAANKEVDSLNKKLDSEITERYKTVGAIKVVQARLTGRMVTWAALTGTISGVLTAVAIKFLFTGTP